MHEVFAEVLGYLQNATRYKWIAMAVAWLFCIVAWAGVSSLPDRFEASSRVHVDTQSKLQPLLRGLTVGSQVNAQIKLMQKMFFNRPNLIKVARAVDLDLHAKDSKQMDDVIDDLKDSIGLKNSGRDFLFTITATNKNPQVAKNIVEALLALFVEQAKGKNREDSDSAQRFLTDQVKEYEVRLQKSELAVENFKRKNYGLLPKQGANPYSQLRTVTAKLTEAKLELDEAQNRWNSLSRQLSGEEPTFLGLFTEDDRSSPLDSRIQLLQQRVDELTLKYTDGHPEVIAAKRSIAELENEKASEYVDGEGYLSSNIHANPVFQKMKISQGDVAAEIASLQVRVKAYQDQVDLIRKQMDRRLQVETELKNLNRDYALIQKNYQTLLSRRESAELSEKVEKTTDYVNFRIVDPPRVPSIPSFPNRILFSSLVLVAGVGLGVAVALLLSFLKPTFSNAQKIRDITGLPILGQVSMNWIPGIKQKKWIAFVRFCGLGLVLFLLFVGVIVLEINGLNLSSV